ncbi:MAG: amino acid ABC transporter ATP-binding protein [Clostridia bacterium]|nr:amino acid ABC transporter ATP-binding protein [Clostridia bacterium]
MAFLEVKNLTKSFGELQVLKGIDVAIEKGEVLSVIGSSGNGKTTFLRCLNNLETPNGGEIIVDNKTVFPKSKTEADGDDNLTFGLVFQSFNLFPQYTALQNLTLALNARAETRLKKQKLGFFERKRQLKQIKKENEEYGLQLLNSVGLSDKVNYYPCQLSGGQCQRVAIARAMALKPKILCFDEPTSALDPELTGEVLKVIKELKQVSKITMVIVTHEMEFAKSISDKVLFMADGKVCEFGTPYEVFDNPKNELTKHFLTSYKNEG